MKSAALILAALVLGCAVPDRHGPMEIIAPAAVVQAPDRTLALCAWAARKGEELSDRFGVAPPAWDFIDAPSEPSGHVTILGAKFGIAYHCGLYHADLKLCQVWLRAPNGEPYSLAQSKRTALHEWLHHHDAEKGIPDPDGSHNDLFEARIDSMGLDR